MGIPALTKCHIRLIARKPPDNLGNRKAYPFEPVSIGDKLRKKRLDLGLSQQDIAQMLNKTKSTIRNWEANRFCPRKCDEQKIKKFITY
jgi:DNA-binding transcriptional regulator YiaG